MWYPRNSLFSTENFTSLNTGDFTYSNFVEQNNLGGYVALRNISAATGVVIPAGQPWPTIDWLTKTDFSLPWYINSGSLSTNSGTPIWNSAYQTTSLTGVVSIDQTIGFNFTNGYLVECGVMVSSQTGIGSYPNDTYGLAIQEGTGSNSKLDFVRFETYPYPGLRVNPGAVSGELFIPASGIDTSIFRFRMGRRGDLLQIIGQNGFSAISTGALGYGGSLAGTGYLTFSGASIGNFSKRILGTNTDSAARIELDHLYIKYPIDDVAGDFIADTEYMTGSVSTFTGLLISDSAAAKAMVNTWPNITVTRYTPEKPIRGYASISYKLVGENPGGATIIGTLSDDDHLTLLGIYSYTGQYYSTGGLFNIDLSTDDTLPNYTGSLRVLIAQVSETGFYRPPLAVEYVSIAVNADDHDGIVYLYPEFGSSDGEYPIVVAIDPFAKSHVTEPSNLDSTLISLIPFQTNATSYTDIGSTSETVGSLTCLTGNVTTRGFFGGTARSFNRTELTGATAIDEIFKEFSAAPIYGTHYKTLHAGNGDFLASTGFVYLWPSGALTGTNFTGVATGTGGYWLTPYQSTYAWTPTGGQWWSANPTILTSPNSNGQSSFIAQHFEGWAGHGFQTQYIDATSFSPGDLIVEALIKCEEGAVGIGVAGYNATNIYTHSGLPAQYVVYPSERFASTQRVRSVFPKPTGKFLINFIGIDHTNTNTLGSTYNDFTVADVSVGTQTGLGVDFVSASPTDFLNMYQSLSSYNSGCTIDLWYKPDGFGMFGTNEYDFGFTNDPTYISLYGTVDYTTIVKTFSTSAPFAYTMERSIVIDRAGFPVLVQLDGGGDSISLKSSIGLEVNKWNHITAVFMEGDYYKIYINGELAAHYEYNTSPAVSVGIATAMVVGSHICGHMEYLRIREGARTPAKIRVLDSFSGPPRFTTKHELSTGGMIAYYKFGRGTVQDYSSNENHCIITESGSNRNYVDREIEGTVGDAISFNGSIGHADSVKSIYYTGSTLSIGGYLACLTDSSLTPNVLSITGGMNLKVSDNKLVYTYSGLTLTGSTNVVDPFAYRSFLITHNYSAGSVTGTWITGYVGTGQGTGSIGQVVDFTGFITGGSYIQINNILTLGHLRSSNTDVGDVYLDQLFMYTGNFTGLSQFDYRNNLHTPNESIYVNGTAVTGSRVGHVGVYEKEFYVPSRLSFTASGSTINIDIDTDAGMFSVTPAFTYVGARNLIADPVTREKIGEISEKICKTKSPFRIGAVAPEDSVNLAYLSTTPITPESSMTFIDGSDSLEQNLVNAVRSYDITVASGVLFSTYTGNQISITGQVNTEDFSITSYTMIRPEPDFAAPLFYAHRLGYESLYPIVVGGSDSVTGDFISLRKSISLIDEQGIPITLEDFPWDIRASKYREDGVTLPENVYSVDILSRDKFIYGKTVFAVYNASNPVANYEVIRNHIESVNPKPIYRKLNGNSPITGETYSITSVPRFTNLATGSNLNNNIRFTVNMRSGAWTPYMHDMYISREELIED